MRRISTETKNALIKQCQKRFAMDGIDLLYDDEALEGVVEKASTLGTGARRLRSVMENTMLDIMFNIHERPDIGVCRITEGTVLQGEAPIYEERKASA